MVWPQALIDVVAVKDWISKAFPGHPEVIGPTQIFQVKEWSVVARFSVTISNRSQEVIFKACHLSLFIDAPSVYELIWRHFPDHTPEMLAHEAWEEKVWYLFRPFSGQVISSIEDGSPIVEVARVFAEIQGTLADLPPSEFRSIPRVALDELPERFEDLRKASDQFQLPRDMHNLFSHLMRWTDEMISMAWPDSVDHVDLHRDNAALNAKGSVLIFDWEESVLGCPFFSIERLLWDAEEFGIKQEVLQTYLETIPWQTMKERRRAFDLAQCLSPVQREIERATFRRAQGLSQINPWEKLRPNLSIWARFA